MSRGRKLSVSLYLCAAVIFSVCASADAQILSAQEFSGRATGINAAITTNGSTSTTVTGDTCPLPARGGTSTVTTSGPLIVGVLGSGNVTSTTSGGGLTSQSSSSVSDFFFSGGGWTVRARNVTSRTQCNCCDIAAPGCAGESTVSGLTVTDPSGASFPVTVTGAANQTVNLPGGAGTITFNERVVAAAAITVIGMHINITSGSSNWNVVVGMAYSDILCSGIGPTPGEASVSGHVTDQNGVPIGRATVRISNTQGQVVRSAMSSDTGAYSLANITTGQTYVVTAEHKSYNFQPVTINLLEDTTGVNLRGVPR